MLYTRPNTSRWLRNLSVMYKLSDIVALDIELSSKCNAECPLCPRNFHGYPENRGYTEHNMTLAEFQHIARPEFLQQLQSVWINGNFGDMLMNPDTVNIIRYIKEHSTAHVSASTNGGARDRQFWQDLAQLGVTVHFCIDGLDDTHSIYRKNTVYNVVISNAQKFIAAGGDAVWKMIQFDHNVHQVDRARQLSQELGFRSHDLVDHGRSNSPVYNQQKQLLHVIGTVPHTDFQALWDERFKPDIQYKKRDTGPVSCKAQNKKELYITSTGDVYPCCFMGFNPNTYERGMNTYYNTINQELEPLVANNNALKHSLETCIEWFNQIPQTWNNNPLMACNDFCGSNSLYSNLPT